MPAARAGRFACLAGEECDMRPPFSIRLFAAPSSFSLCERKRRAPCGCRRKRGLFAFGLPSNSNRCSASFVKYSFSCGLCPKAAAVEKSDTSIVWHLSGWTLCVCARAMLSRSKATLSVKVSNRFQFPLWRVFRMCIFSLSAAAPWAKQYLPHPLAAAALLVERMRKNFQIAAQTMTKNLSMRSSPKHRKAAASPLFLCTGRDAFLFSHEKKEMWGAIASPRAAREIFPPRQGHKKRREGANRSSACKAEKILTGPLLSAAPAEPYTKSSLRPRWAR